MRTTLDYIQGGGKLNNASSSTPSGSTEPVTGLPISTGTNSGDFIELTDAQAAQLSLNGLVASILTAGSGQTAGTYTASASYGPAVLTYVVAGGGTITAIPTISNANGQYTPAFVTANGGSLPTFTIAAGGTPATIGVASTTLHAGVYQRVKLTSTITSVTIGSPLYWNVADTTDPYAVTNVVPTSVEDFAGVVIDPTMGTTPANSPQLTYGWIQCTGRATILAPAAGLAIAVAYGLPTTGTTFSATAATPLVYAGSTLAAIAASVAGNLGLARLVIPQTKY